MRDHLRFVGCEVGRPARADTNDVEILVVGDVDPTKVWDSAARATSRLGIEVNVVVRDLQEWDDDGTGFVAEVARQPTLEVLARDRRSDDSIVRSAGR